MKSIQFEENPSFRLPPKVLQKRLHQVIQEKLSENQREILIAYYFQQKSTPKIAAERGVSVSTVCRTLHRAEENLKQYLKY